MRLRDYSCRTSDPTSSSRAVLLYHCVSKAKPTTCHSGMRTNECHSANLLAPLHSLNEFQKMPKLSAIYVVSPFLLRRRSNISWSSLTTAPCFIFRSDTLGLDDTGGVPTSTIIIPLLLWSISTRCWGVLCPCPCWWCCWPCLLDVDKLDILLPGEKCAES